MSLIIGECIGKGIASQAIGWFGGGYFSHTTTLLPNKRFVLDARADEVGGKPTGVQLRPVGYLEKMYGSGITWLKIPCSSIMEQLTYSALYSQLGKPYDTIGILDYALGRLRDRNWMDKSAWFCSELAVWSWIEGKFLSRPLVPSAEPNRITPGGSVRIAWGLGARVITQAEAFSL